MHKHASCHVGDCLPVAFSNAIHFLVSGCSYFNFDAVFITKMHEFFREEVGGSVSMDEFDVVDVAVHGGDPVGELGDDLRRGGIFETTDSTQFAMMSAHEEVCGEGSLCGQGIWVRVGDGVHEDTVPNSWWFVRVNFNMVSFA